MALVPFYSRVTTLQVSRAIYPCLIRAGTKILAELFHAVLNLLKTNEIMDTTHLHLEQSIFRDSSVLKSDAIDKWNHVFTNKNGHINPSRDEERTVVALVLEVTRKLGKRVPLLDKAAENFKRRYEFFFKEFNIRIWVRECRKGNSDEYYIESGGMYVDHKASLNEVDTGGELLKLLSTEQ